MTDRAIPLWGRDQHEPRGGSGYRGPEPGTGVVDRVRLNSPARFSGATRDAYRATTAAAAARPAPRAVQQYTWCVSWTFRLTALVLRFKPGVGYRGGGSRRSAPNASSRIRNAQLSIARAARKNYWRTAPPPCEKSRRRAIGDGGGGGGRGIGDVGGSGGGQRPCT